MEAKQTPLIELLERVPQNARCRVDEPDGMGSVFIPVGKLCHEAAAALRAALAQQAEPNVEYERGFIDGMQKQAQSSVDRAVNRMAEQAMLGVWQDVPGAVNFGITGDNNG